VAFGALPTIKGTMKMHQVVCLSPGKLIYRDVSCVCKVSEGVLDCECYKPNQFVMDISHCDQNVEQVSNDTPPPNLPSLSRPDPLCDDHVGQYCVVLYDEKPYPGMILDAESGEIKVKCMASLGRNRFIWPTPRDDINWYGGDQVLSMIPEPVEHGTRRKYFAINNEIWDGIEKKLEINTH